MTVKGPDGQVLLGKATLDKEKGTLMACSAVFAASQSAPKHL